MSAMGAEDESGTVREEGACEEVKAAEITLSHTTHAVKKLPKTTCL